MMKMTDLYMICKWEKPAKSAVYQILVLPTVYISAVKLLKHLIAINHINVIVNLRLISFFFLFYISLDFVLLAF